MDRRSFLALGAVSAGALVFGSPATALAAPVPGLIWAADFSTARDSAAAGFGNVQTQSDGQDIRNDGPAMPVVDHPTLGRALRIALEKGQTRYEAAPGGGEECKEGEEYFFRVDFVLDPDFPVGQPNPFCVVNQVHQGSGSGSPPIEFDVSDNRLSVRGASTAYAKDLGPVAVDTVYRLVYRVVFSAEPNRSVLEVWVDGRKALSGFRTPCPTIDGGESYWKGATMYCQGDIPPLTVYQNAHRVGRTYESVAS